MKAQRVSKMNPAKPCTVCGNACKSVSKCKSLRIPPEGFYSGGGGGGHSHDDDCEESLSFAHLLCDEGRRLIAPQPFAQTYSQDGEVPPTRPMRVSVLHTIPNRPSNVRV